MIKKLSFVCLFADLIYLIYLSKIIGKIFLEKPLVPWSKVSKPWWTQQVFNMGSVQGPASPWRSCRCGVVHQLQSAHRPGGHALGFSVQNLPKWRRKWRWTTGCSVKWEYCKPLSLSSVGLSCHSVTSTLQSQQANFVSTDFTMTQGSTCTILQFHCSGISG